MQHEDDILGVVRACLVLHNMCLGAGDDGEDFLADALEEEEHEVATSATGAGKRARDALLHYLICARGDYF